MRSTVQNSVERFRIEIARGQSGRNLLGLLGSGRPDHCQLSVTRSYKGNGGGGMLLYERFQLLLQL